jgi:hypothetical protein
MRSYTDNPPTGYDSSLTTIRSEVTPEEDSSEVAFSDEAQAANRRGRTKRAMTRDTATQSVVRGAACTA